MCVRDRLALGLVLARLLAFADIVGRYGQERGSETLMCEKVVHSTFYQCVRGGRGDVANRYDRRGGRSRRGGRGDDSYGAGVFVERDKETIVPRPCTVFKHDMTVRNNVIGVTNFDRLRGWWRRQTFDYNPEAPTCTVQEPPLILVDVERLF